ncbi:MAG: hypothetical protein LBK55_10135 [Azoarcus sp.]|jgi:hypothetical protein|nr:hypothetical protein [Azoarcus sp.]
MDDDYDYESSSWQAKVSNALTESVLDPWKIGQRVIIKFTGNIHIIHNFSMMDLPMLENQNNRLKALQVSSITQALKFPELYTKKMNSLAAKGILYWKEHVPFPVSPSLPGPLSHDLPTGMIIARDEL